MLTEAHNRLLTRVENDAPMGRLLRRYWHPVAGASEFDSASIKPLRLFGEDLVLYRDLAGTYGLVDRHCPHRRADLAMGYVDEQGIRCSYHGWLMGGSGEVLAAPYDDIVMPQGALKRSCRTVAYPVRELAGLLWAYLGEGPAPELPVWEMFTRPNGFCEIVLSDIPCNWLQCQENSIDPVHFEWLHENWPSRMAGNPDAVARRHLKVEFDEFRFGLTYRRLREGMSQSDEMWTIGRVCLWPNAFYLGDHIEWRVPIDNENTLSISWFYTRVPLEQEPYRQDSIPTWTSPIRDGEGRWITSHVINQDIVGWVGQGRIADRTKEHLSVSDKGIAMLRRRLLRDLEALEKGQDPSRLIRDGAEAKLVELPNANAQYGRAMPREEWLAHPFVGRRAKGNPWAAGQPEAVRAAFLAATGLS